MGGTSKNRHSLLTHRTLWQGRQNLRKAASASSQTTENMPREGLGRDAAFREYEEAAKALIETNPHKRRKKSTLGSICLIIIQLVIDQ